MIGEQVVLEDPGFFSDANLFYILRTVVGGLLLALIIWAVKKILSRGPKPKVHFKYRAFIKGSVPGNLNSRRFTIDAELIIDNLTPFFIYDLELKFKTERWQMVRSNRVQVGENPITLNVLDPRQKWVVDSREQVPIANYVELNPKPSDNEIIPDYFKNLKVVLYFKNEKDKKFKMKFSHKEDA